jgi:glutamate racemase
MMNKGPIGIFDSGYGGLTVFKSIVKRLPQYDYCYLGDNARAPYGTRSLESIYRYTLESVRYLFGVGCPLVILACNTASAKALRNIQQKYLPAFAPDNRVLGVIRPTAEVIGNFSKSGHVGVLGTPGTVNSESYLMEIQKFFPDLKVFQEACPMWVPLVENNEIENPGTGYFVKKHIDAILNQSPKIDTLLLGCTHYPLLIGMIRNFTGPQIKVIPQGEIVADSLADYLSRHPEMEARCTRNNSREFFTTDSADSFNERAKIFYGEEVKSQHVNMFAN